MIMAEDNDGAGNRADQPGGIISQASQRDNPTGPAVVHIVQAGETLASIAARYRVSEAELERLNMLTDPGHLRGGEELRIPERAESGATEVGLTSTGLAAGSSETVYQVQPGETLAEIAMRLGTTVETLARMNALDDPNSVQAGQELLVPAAPQRD
jgi:LysM repeat protein